MTDHDDARYPHLAHQLILGALRFDRGDDPQLLDDTVELVAMQVEDDPARWRLIAVAAACEMADALTEAYGLDDAIQMVDAAITKFATRD